MGTPEWIGFGSTPNIGNFNPTNELTIPKLHLTSRVSLAVVEIYGRKCKMSIMCVCVCGIQNAKGNLNKYLRKDAYKKSATKGREQLITADKVFVGKKGQQVLVADRQLVMSPLPATFQCLRVACLRNNFQARQPCCVQ